MSITTNARTRAEEMLQTLQPRARELLDAEEGVAKTVRDLVEQSGLPVADVRRHLEDLIGRLGAYKILERVRGADATVIWNDTVGGLEKRVDTSIHWLLSNLQIATTDDVQRMRHDVETLRTRLDGLDEKLGRPARTSRQPEN